MSYGLQIRNSSGYLLCDGDHPTLGLKATVNTQYSGNPISFAGVYSTGMIAPYSLSYSNYPVGAVPCSSYTTYHYTGANGIGFICNNTPTQPCSILQPLGTLNPSTGVYGVEVYGPDGKPVWSTNQKQFVVRAVIPIAASTILAQMSSLSTTPTYIYYSPIVANPLYILSGFTAYRADYGGQAPFYTVSGVRKAAVAHAGYGVLALLWTWVNYNYSDGQYWLNAYNYYTSVLSTIPQVSTTQYIIVGELV